MSQLQAQERRILVLAAGITAGLFATAILVLFLAGLFQVETLSPDAGKILVRIGDPQASAPPASPIPPDPQTSMEPLPSQVPATPEAETPVVPEEGGIPAPSPAPAASRAPAASQAPAASLPTPSQAPSPRPQVFKGQDQGNSWQLDSELAGVRFNMSPELAEMLPLPAKVPAGLVDKADAGLKNSYRFQTFQFWYPQDTRDSFGDWRLAPGPVPPAQRIEIWQVLRQLGYRQADADFMSELNAKGSATFLIVIGPGGGRPIRVELEASCGSPGADEGLRQGLMQTSFSNSTGRENRLRFTYTFP